MSVRGRVSVRDRASARDPRPWGALTAGHRAQRAVSVNPACVQTLGARWAFSAGPPSNFANRCLSGENSVPTAVCIISIRRTLGIFATRHRSISARCQKRGRKLGIGNRKLAFTSPGALGAGKHSRSGGKPFIGGDYPVATAVRWPCRALSLGVRLRYCRWRSTPGSVVGGAPSKSSRSTRRGEQ